MSIRNCQSQRIKGIWKDIEDIIKKMVYRQREMLVIDSEIKINSQDINTKTLCKEDSYECREKGHPQDKVWHPRETKDIVNSPVDKRDQPASWEMKSDEVYNRGSRKTHERESMNYFNLGSLM